MDNRQFDLTITIPIDIGAESLVERAADLIPESLTRDGWDEGRYPFYTELFGEGLGQMLRRAVFDSVLEIMKEKYGPNHMTAYGNDGKYNTAYHAAEEWVRNELKWLNVNLCGSDWKVSLAPKENRND